MPDDTYDPAAAEATGAPPPQGDAIEAAQSALRDSLANAEKRITEAAKVAERVIRETVETLRERARAYTGSGGDTLDDAQRYLAERVKERPVTAVAAGIGLGLLIGLMLASHGE